MSFLILISAEARADFNSLSAQDIDNPGGAGHIALAGGNDVGKGGLLGAGINGIAALLVEVFENLTLGRLEASCISR